MNAEIITIGTEILIGQIVDSNSAWLGEQLNLLGIDVYQIRSISDDTQQIKEALDDVHKNTKLVLVTGGLGPTNDDITKETISSYFKRPLVVHDDTLKTVISYFEHVGKIPSEVNLKQAEVPEGSVALKNVKGTAPGIWIEHNDKIFVFMPGVPFEMKSIFSDEIKPKLKQFKNDKVIIHRTLLLQGIAESVLAEMLSSLESALPDGFSLAYLPRPGILRLRLTAKGGNRCKLEYESQEYIEEIYRIAGKYIYGEDNVLLEELIQKIFIENNLKLSIAESCTGGGIASRVTSLSGSSGYFMGSVVAYDNNIKEKILEVHRTDLDTYGAVSKEVVTQMAKEIRNKFNTDFAIATSGIAGPTGGTPEKPVGTIWVSVAGPENIITEKLQMGKNREYNIERTIVTALFMLLQEVKKYVL